MTAAFLAAQHQGDPRRRVFVVNLELGTDHIHPVELRDAVFQRLPKAVGSPEVSVAARAIHGAVAKLSDSFGDIARRVAPPWFGGKGLGSNRFVGRMQEFWRLHSCLFNDEVTIVSDHTAASHVQLRAMAGMGKSLLAEEYALRFGAAYPGGIFVASGMRSRDDQVVDFAMRLGLEVQGKKIAEVEGLLERHLRAAGQRYLWIVDDLPSGMNELERRRWLAPNNLGKTLSITRSREYESSGGVVDLEALDLEEGLELLTARRRPNGPAEDAAARGIIAELGGHALAIDVAGGALAKLRGEQTYAEFLARLKDPGPEALEAAAQLRPELPNGHERSIVRTLRGSIEQLDDCGRDFLRLASVLATDVIPNDLIVDVFLRIGKAVPHARSATNIAVEQCLVEKVGESPSEVGGYHVHSLVARVAPLCDESGERADLIRRHAIKSLLDILPGVEDVRTHPSLAAHVAHARHLAALPSDETEAALLMWVARYDHHRASFASARNSLETVLALRGRLLGEEHYDTLAALNNLAQTKKAQGDWVGARADEERALDICQRVLGPHHDDTLAARLNLAGTLKAQGDWRAALAHEGAILRLRCEVLGDEHPRSLTARNNLAGTFFEVGDLVSARDHQTFVLAARRKVLGADHHLTLLSQSNLAATLLYMGDVSAARVLQESAVTELERLYPEPDHPAVRTARKILSEIRLVESRDKASGTADPLKQ